MRLRLKRRTAAGVIALIGVLMLGTAYAMAATLNISGYETSAGQVCSIDGQPGTCDTTFSGWTGGTGPVAGGWTPYPGDGQGSWTTSVNYTGMPGLGSMVVIRGGSWA